MINFRQFFIVFIIFTIYNRQSVADECNSNADTEMCSLEPPKQDVKDKDLDHEKNKYSKGYYILHLLFYLTGIECFIFFSNSSCNFLKMPIKIQNGLSI